MVNRFEATDEEEIQRLQDEFELPDPENPLQDQVKEQLPAKIDELVEEISAQPDDIHGAVQELKRKGEVWITGEREVKRI